MIDIEFKLRQLFPNGPFVVGGWGRMRDGYYVEDRRPNEPPTRVPVEKDWLTADFRNKYPKVTLWEYK